MNNSFLGTGWGFPPEFSLKTKDVILVSKKEDIEQSLTILLSTRCGERVLNPLYGCRIHDLVFETIDEGTKALIIDSIQHAILFFESRISVEDVFIDTSRTENGRFLINDGRLLINIEYTIRATNTRSNMVYPFYLREGTLL